MLKEMFEFLKNYKALVVPWVATFLGIGFILSTRMDLMQKLLWEAVLLDAFIISMLAFAPLPRRAKTEGEPQTQGGTLCYPNWLP